MYSLKSLLSGIYPLPETHSLLVTLYVMEYFNSVNLLCGPAVCIYSLTCVIGIINLTMKPCLNGESCHYCVYTAIGMYCL